MGPLSHGSRYDGRSGRGEGEAEEPADVGGAIHGGVGEGDCRLAVADLADEGPRSVIGASLRWGTSVDLVPDDPPRERGSCHEHNILDEDGLAVLGLHAA